MCSTSAAIKFSEITYNPKWTFHAEICVIGVLVFGGVIHVILKPTPSHTKKSKGVGNFPTMLFVWRGAGDPQKTLF